MKTRNWIVAASLVVLLSGSGSVLLAAEAPEMPQPTAEHKELALWIGSWSGKGEMKAGPFGPGGPMAWTEECSWFGGSEFHVICHSKGTVPTGPMKGMGIIGYDPNKKVYTHYGVDNNGWAGFSEGTRSGKSWTYRGSETVEGKTYHSRFNMTMTSATKMDFDWQMSEDGTDWVTLMEGTAEKK